MARTFSPEKLYAVIKRADRKRREGDRTLTQESIIGVALIRLQLQHKKTWSSIIQDLELDTDTLALYEQFAREAVGKANKDADIRKARRIVTAFFLFILLIVLLTAWIVHPYLLYSIVGGSALLWLGNRIYHWRKRKRKG